MAWGGGNGISWTWTQEKIRTSPSLPLTIYPKHRTARGSGAYRITRDKEETPRAATSDLRAWEGGDWLVVLMPPLLTGCLESLEGTCAQITGTGTVGAQTESAERL